MAQRHTHVCAVLLLLLLPAASAQAVINCFADGTWSRSDFAYCKELTSDYALHWNVEDSVIKFGIAVAGKYKYFALGFSDSGGLHGTDLAVVRKEESATAGTAWAVGDYWSNGTTAPQPDAQQDVTLVSYSATALSTLVVLSRPIDTCDAQDWRIYNDTDILVVFGLGQAYTALLNGADSLQGSYTLRLIPAAYNSSLANITGSVSNTSTLNLSNTTEYTYRLALQAQDPADLRALALRMPSVDVPTRPKGSIASGTTSYCMAQALASKAKYHIIRYGAYLDPSLGKSPVARMILYACSAQPAVFEAHECSEPDPLCQQAIAFWGPGMANFSAPASAGIPFGAAPQSRYVQLVVEYNSVEIQPGGITPVDQSGMNLYWTAQLRPYDLGVLRLGTAQPNASLAAPNATADDWCPSACTARLTSNLTLVANVFVMGSTGLAIKTRHIRGGREIQPTGSKSFWWDGWQAPKQVLPDSRQLQPGDTLTTSCTYNASSLPANALCLNYLYYFPAVTGWTSCGREEGSYLAACSLPLRVSSLGPAFNGSTRTNASATATDALVATLYDRLMAVADAVAGGANLSLPIPLTPATLLEPVTAATTVVSMITANNSSYVAQLQDAVHAAVRAGSASRMAAESPQVASLEAQLEANAALQDFVATSIANYLNTATSVHTYWTVPYGDVMGAIHATLAALNASLIVATLPEVLLQLSDDNVTAYVEACTAVAGDNLPVRYATGPAIASIVLLSAAMLAVLAYLWVNYARKEDPERQALLSALQQTILEEAVEHPDLTEEELRHRLEDQVRRRLQAEGILPQ